MDTRPGQSVSIVMPAYNEELNIENTVRRCLAALESNNLEGEIVVTNDGSKDSTGKILEQLKKEIPQLVVLHHTTNTGYGGALKDAIKHSTKDLVVSIDSDGQFDIFELPILLKKLSDGYDAVAGCREKKKDTLFRVVADRGLNWIVWLLFGLRFKDNNSAYKLYKGELIRGLTIESRGYQTPTEILIKLETLGCKIGEVKISHLAREQGRSSLKALQTILEMLSFLSYLKLKIILYNRKIITQL